MNNASICNFQKKRVLIVEDNVDIREMLEVLLADSGHEIFATGEGKVAIQEGVSSRYDVVLSDIGLPDVDGWTIAKMIRRRHADTKIYLLTGWSHLVDTARARIAEIDGIYKKPYSAKLIFALIEGTPVDANVLALHP